MSDWDPLLTIQNVHVLHRAGIERHGGDPSPPPNEGCVEGCLGNAWTAELYQEDTSGLVRGFAFAGYVLYYLARNHCFVDGNKRVAWLCCLWVFSNLGLTVNATTEDAEGMILNVISGDIRTGGDVVSWFSERVVADQA